eukprot:COSAG06_NODE_18968_length_859_cov_52.610526_1_plen_258_part_10
MLAASVLCQWLEHASSGGDEYEAGAASAAVHCLCGWECGLKMSPESREPIEKSTGLAMKRLLAAAGILTEQRAQEVFETGLKAGMLTDEDVSLACGWCTATFYIAYMFPAALITANDCGLFSTALQLYRRVEPSPLPEEWWSRTCNVVDVTSARQTGIWLGVLSMAKRLPSATQSSWWSELLDLAIRMSKLNASAGLSGRETMSGVVCVQALGPVEVAAQDESQHEMLLASGVADALEYAILHDFTYCGASVAACASG